VWINNQPSQVYYNFRVKGHFEQDWREYYPIGNRYSSGDPPYPTSKYLSNGTPRQSNLQNTVFSFPADYPVNAQLDFQVQAILGHASQVFVDDHPLAPFPIGHYESAVAYDAQSSWSNTQTLTIPETSPSPNPSSVPSPSPEITLQPNPTSQPLQIGNFELILIVILVSALAVVSGLLVYVYRRMKKA
jgi:hypothetical protein